MRIAGLATVAGATGTMLWIALGPHRVGDYYAETDFYGAYAEGARLIQHGHLDLGRYAVVGPVYDLVLATVGFLVRDLFSAGELISVAAASVTLILWLTLLSRRVSSAAGLWTVLFLAVNPTFLRYGYSVSTDGVALCLQAAALFALYAQRGRRAPAWAGILAALAILTRYNAVYLVPGAIASYLWLANPAARAARWRSIVVYLGGLLVLLLPWVAFSTLTGHRPGGELFHNIAYDIYAHARGLTWDQYQTRLQPEFHSLWDVLRRDPPAVLKRELHNLVTHLWLDLKNLLGWPAAITCGLGVALALRDGTWRQLLPFGVIGSFLFLTLVPVLHSNRYSLPLAPMYLTLAGAAVASPLFTSLWGRGSVPLKWAAALLPLWLSGKACSAQQKYLMSQLPVEVLPASEALRATAPAGARVMGRKPHIAYYSGLTFVPFPNVATLQDLAAYCREHHVEFMYFSWPEADLRPQFSYLLDTGADLPGLTVLRTVEHNPAVVYRVGPEFGEIPPWLADETLREVHMARAEVLMHEEEAWRAHLTLGLHAGREGRYEEALQHLLVVTRVRPDLPRGWILAGEAYLKLGRIEQAERAFSRVLKQDPKNVDARLGLGWAQFHAGRLAQAAATWRPVVEQTTHIPTLEEMVRLYVRIGDRGAVEAARRALGQAMGKERSGEGG